MADTSTSSSPRDLSRPSPRTRISPESGDPLAAPQHVQAFYTSPSSPTRTVSGCAASSSTRSCGYSRGRHPRVRGSRPAVPQGLRPGHDNPPAKGLEFPVVGVGSLHVATSTGKGVDRVLRPFYGRPPFEPESRVTAFDRMRLHYVAFCGPRGPRPDIHRTTERLVRADLGRAAQWPYVEKELLTSSTSNYASASRSRRRTASRGISRSTRRGPASIEYFRNYDFTPSRSAVIFFGLPSPDDRGRPSLVLDGRLDEITDEVIGSSSKQTSGT